MSILKEKVLGYVLVNTENNALMLDDYNNLYYGGIDLSNDVCKADLVIFESETDKDIWINRGNFCKKFVDGTKVSTENLKTLKLSKILIA